MRTRDLVAGDGTFNLPDDVAIQVSEVTSLPTASDENTNWIVAYNGGFYYSDGSAWYGVGGLVAGLFDPSLTVQDLDPGAYAYLKITADGPSGNSYSEAIWSVDGVDKFVIGTGTSDSVYCYDLVASEAVWNFTPGAGNPFYINTGGVDRDTNIRGLTENNLVYVDAGNDRVGIGTATPAVKLDVTGEVRMSTAGTNAASAVTVGGTQTLTTKTLTAPAISAHSASAGSAMKMTSGTVMTTPEAGAVEYDGAAYYWTNQTTSKRGIIDVYHEFELNANGGAIGATIADFFGSNSSIDLPASSRWYLYAELYYLKTTAGTVTYTITNSAANYTNIAARYTQWPAAGIATNAGLTGAAIVTTTTAAAALPATASLTTAVNHAVTITATIDMNAAGNIRIRCTESAGTITPLRGSFYRISRMPGNTGSFVA